MELRKIIATTIREYLIEQQEFLLAPNGNKSNLPKNLYEYVRTEEFKRWFGDWEKEPESSSKVVDENGEPLVVYHGTPNKFDKFNITDRVISGYNIKEYGIYFTNSIITAKEYASKPDDNDENYKEYLDWNDKLDNFKAKQDWDSWNNLYVQGKDKFDIRSFKPSKNGKIFECFLNIRNPFVKNANGKNWFSAFKNISFSGDGVICLNVIEVNNDLQNTYIVYNQNQIKLAI